MKTRKIVIAVLMTALLISAMLIVGCIDQFDGISAKKAEDNYIIPPGKGVVKLNIRDIDINARTILPDKIAGQLIEDMFFDVQFKKTSTNGAGGTGTLNQIIYFPGGTSVVPTTKATWTEVQAPIILDSNWKYSYIITAYDKKTGSPVPIAGYTSANDALAVGTSVTAEGSNINLVALINNIYDGTFSYDITIVNDDAYDYGNVNLIEIEPYPSGTKIEIVLETDDSGSGSGSGTGSGVVSGDSKTINFSDTALSLPSGYYTVKVTLSKGAKFATKQYTEALHIYPAMTSTMTPLVIPALDKIKLDVTFSTTGSPTITNTPNLTDQLIDYGKKATDPAPLATGYTFDGWYVDMGGGGNVDYKWDFNDRVFKDLPLYAQWLSGGGKFTNITFSYSDEIDALVTTSSLGKLYRGDFDGTLSVVIDFDTGGDAWDDFVWDINGIISVSGLVVNDPAGDNSTDNIYRLTINNDLDGDFGTLLGTTEFTVSVYATLEVNSVKIPYSKSITIQVLEGTP